MDNVKPSWVEFFAWIGIYIVIVYLIVNGLQSLNESGRKQLAAYNEEWPRFRIEQISKSPDAIDELRALKYQCDTTKDIGFLSKEEMACMRVAKALGEVKILVLRDSLRNASSM